MNPNLTPPLFGIAPGLQCNRLMGGSDDVADACGKPATWHIFWTPDLENGICCDHHAAEARSRWVFYAIHEYEVTCSMPGAIYNEALNKCFADDEDFWRYVHGLADATEDVLDAAPAGREVTA